MCGPIGPRLTREKESGLEATRYIVGERLKTFRDEDPSVEVVRAFGHLEESKRWEKLREHFLKYVSVHRESVWEGKEDVAALTEWDSSLTHFFITHPVLNVVAQATLAVSTFRGHARHWWFSKMQLYPRLVVSYKQLLEWVRVELVPAATPQKAAQSLVCISVSRRH